MLDVPQRNESLAWIASHKPNQLLLIPGLQGTLFTAAAGEDQQVLAQLRCKAQEQGDGMQPEADMGHVSTS